MGDYVDDSRTFTINLLVEGQAVFVGEPSYPAEAYENDVIPVTGTIMNDSPQADTLFVNLKLNDVNGTILDSVRQIVGAGATLNFNLETTMGNSDLTLYLEVGHEGR